MSCPIVTQFGRSFINPQIHLVTRCARHLKWHARCRHCLKISNCPNRVVARKPGRSRALSRTNENTLHPGGNPCADPSSFTSANAAVALHQLAEQEHIDMVALSAHGIFGEPAMAVWAAWSTISSCYGKIPLLIVAGPARQTRVKSASADIQGNLRALAYAGLCRKDIPPETCPSPDADTRLIEFAAPVGGKHTRLSHPAIKKSELFGTLGKAGKQALQDGLCILQRCCHPKDLAPFPRARPNGCWDNYYLVKQIFPPDRRSPCRPVFSISLPKIERKHPWKRGLPRPRPDASSRDFVRAEPTSTPPRRN